MNGRNRLWESASGDRVRIRNLEDQHLVNVLNFLERRAVEDFIEIPFPAFSGEMASYYAEGEYYSLMKEGPRAMLPDIYDDLVEEVRLRRLTWRSRL